MDTVYTTWTGLNPTLQKESLWTLSTLRTARVSCDVRIHVFHIVEPRWKHGVQKTYSQLQQYLSLTFSTFETFECIFLLETKVQGKRSKQRKQIEITTDKSPIRLETHDAICRHFTSTGKYDAVSHSVQSESMEFALKVGSCYLH